MAPPFRPEELRQVYERFAPTVYRLAFRLLRRDAEAWDAVHEVFRLLLENGAGFERRAEPMTYIYRITTNVALSALRARGVREPSGGTGRAEAAEFTESTDADGVEAREFLSVLVHELDERARRIAALHFVQGLSQEEVAEVVGLSRKTVGKELDAIRQKARILREVSHA